jgi:hypothetical protein
MIKSLSFHSRYLPNFQVVEQRVGNNYKFPHTDQLPKLLRALNFEFFAGLPDRIARVDRRANDFMKMQRHVAAVLFCNLVNESRPDGLILHVIPDRDLVAKIGIVQHHTEYREPGALHRFKFFGGSDLFLDFYINNKVIVFSDHAMKRITERVPNPTGVGMCNFFGVFFSSPTVLMMCNKTPSFIYYYGNSVVAFPVRQSDTDAEYFLPTCLNCEVIGSLEPIMPSPAYTIHYDAGYREPSVRNWNPIVTALAFKKLWERGLPPYSSEPVRVEIKSWSKIAHNIKRVLEKQGHGERSRFAFLDNIPGPAVIKLLPDQKEDCHVELDYLKKMQPEVDWEHLVPEQKAANPAWY